MAINPLRASQQKGASRRASRRNSSHSSLNNNRHNSRRRGRAVVVVVDEAKARTKARPTWMSCGVISTESSPAFLVAQATARADPDQAAMVVVFSPI